LLAGVYTTVRQSVAGWVFLGRELAELKEDLGCVGAGRRIPAREGIKSWPDYTRSELGLSDDMADRCIAAYKVIQHRGKALLSDDSEEFRVLIAPPATLSVNEQKRLQDAVGKLLKGDETQRSMLREFRLIRESSRLPGGKTSGNGKPFEQLAAEVMIKSFFQEAAEGMKAASKRIHAANGDGARKILEKLHLASSEGDTPCLQDAKATLEMFLEDTIPALVKDVEAARENLKNLLRTADELIEEKRQPVAVKRPRKNTTKSKQ
jgi:hypothetical protein